MRGARAKYLRRVARSYAEQHVAMEKNSGNLDGDKEARGKRIGSLARWGLKQYKRVWNKTPHDYRTELKRVLTFRLNAMMSTVSPGR